VADLLLHRLLWDPLPDPLPKSESGRFRCLRHLAASIATEAATAWLSEQKRIERRVDRGRAQAVVREAYQQALAEQDTEHRRPDALAQAWKAHLVFLLDRPHVDLHGWGEFLIADLDASLVWTLYEVASRARQQAIERASATVSKPTMQGAGQTPTFEFTIASDGSELGYIQYGLCSSCRVGLLYKIEFDYDWQFCGLGSLALNALETRHDPDLAWYTTPQFKHALGFYDRYRQGSASPWTAEHNPCPHFR
jgi:hypothetical protein